jgi:hypothetical protein
MHATLELTRTAVGLITVLQHPADPVARRGLRLAGARHILQGALTLAVPELRVLGIAVDGLHAASMLALAIATRRFRVPALAQAVVAAALAAAELRAIPPRGGSRAHRRAR